jgi:hypothetical protein
MANLRSGQQSTWLSKARGFGTKLAMISAVPLLATPAGAQSISVRKIGQCPTGYASGAHWCTPMPGNKRDAIPKGQRGCPSGWIVSGAYCLSPERRR